MTRHPFPTLLVAALTATFVSVAVAQTQSDDASRMPAKKGMAQESQTHPSMDQTQKMKGQEGSNTQAQNPADQMKGQKSASPSQSEAMASDQHKAKTDKNASAESAHEHMASNKGMKHAEGMKHGARSKRMSEEAAAPDEKAYRDALRVCAKQQNEGLRDSCIDSAIEKFHRNA